MHNKHIIYQALEYTKSRLESQAGGFIIMNILLKYCD